MEIIKNIIATLVVSMLLSISTYAVNPKAGFGSEDKPYLPYKNGQYGYEVNEIPPMCQSKDGCFVMINIDTPPILDKEMRLLSDGSYMVNSSCKIDIVRSINTKSPVWKVWYIHCPLRDLYDAAKSDGESVERYLFKVVNK